MFKLFSSFLSGGVRLRKGKPSEASRLGGSRGAQPALGASSPPGLQGGVQGFSEFPESSCLEGTPRCSQAAWCGTSCCLVGHLQN